MITQSSGPKRHWDNGALYEKEYGKMRIRRSGDSSSNTSSRHFPYESTKLSLDPADVDGMWHGSYDVPSCSTICSANGNGNAQLGYRFPVPRFICVIEFGMFCDFVNTHMTIPIYISHVMLPALYAEDPP
ncbi:hypothetical protein Tco_1038388 [Tanacetum coccineum]